MSWLSEYLNKYKNKPVPMTPPTQALIKKAGVITESTAKGKVWGVGDINDIVKLIQEALRKDGQEIRPDGEFGDITTTAVKRFQAAHGLEVDGWVGPDTAAELDKVLASPAKSPLPPMPLPSTRKGAPWVSDVRACTGIKEVPGSANSPLIMSWRQDIAKAFPEMASYAAGYTGDSIPWCGFGLAGSFCRVGIRPPFGKSGTQRFMWADSWRAPNWGISLVKPVPGCVMTFSRTGGNHVALLEKLVGDTAYIRGFNQSDMVNVAKKNMSTFTAATWPTGFPIIEVAGDISNAVASGSEA